MTTTRAAVLAVAAAGATAAAATTTATMTVATLTNRNHDNNNGDDNSNDDYRNDDGYMLSFAAAHPHLPPNAHGAYVERGAETNAQHTIPRLAPPIPASAHVCSNNHAGEGPSHACPKFASHACKSDSQTPVNANPG